MDKQISQIMTRDIVSLSPDALLSEAARKMSGQQISCMLVMQQEQLAGILTEKDLVHALCGGSHVKEESVRQFMTESVLTVNQDMDIYEAFDFMRSHGIRHLVAVDDQQTVTGMVTLTDLANATDASDFLEFKSVARIMTANPHTLAPEDTILHAVEMMDQLKVSCIVIAKENKPVGILTERDVASLVHSEQFRPADPVAKYMISPVKTVHVDTIALEASSLMHKHHLRRLVVVDEGGCVSGIVTLYDVIKGLTGRYIEQLRKSLAEKSEALDSARAELTQYTMQDHLLHETPVVHYSYQADDSMLKPVFVTPNILKLLGYQNDQFIADEGWWLNQLHPDEADAIMAKRRQVMASLQTHFSCEYRFRHVGEYLSDPYEVKG